MLENKGKISSRQATILFLTLVYSPAIRLFPVFTAKTAERAGWLTPLFAVLPFICLVYVIQALFKNKKEKNLSDIFFEILGNIPGRILLSLYLLWSMVLLGVYVRYFAERFLTALIPNTPMSFFILTILAVVFYTTRRGIVQLTRTIEFFFFIFTIVFLFLFLLTLTNIKFINLYPITHYDIWPIIKSTSTFFGICGYYSFIFFFGDKISDKENIKKFGLQSAVYLLITSLILLIQTIGVYGYTIIQRVPLPYFIVIKSISILETIEKIESVVLAFWVIVDFAIISIFMYIIVSIIKSLFSLSETKPLISPITMFAYVFSLYAAKNSFELANLSNYIGSVLNIIFGFGFPFLLFFVKKVRKIH